ncbi:hypothetical protein Tco_0714600 [Tanacetum coccineum]
MLAPKCATYNGRSTFANPKYLKIAQSEKPRLYEIPYDTSDPANRFCPNGEETVTLEKESRSKLDKDKKAKKSAQLQKDKEVNGKPSNYDPARLPNTANCCKPKQGKWQASMDMPISASKPKRKTNKSVATTHKKTVASDTTIQKPKSYFKELYENTNKAWKWWIEKKCPLEYKWTQTTPSRPSLKWKPTGRIFSNVRFRWIPTGKLFNSCTGKVESEPTNGSNVDIPHIHAGKQTLGLSAGTSFNGQKQQRIDLNADALYNEKQENLRVWLLKLLISKKPVPEWPRSSMFKRCLIAADQASVFMAMTFEQRSSSLVLHQMTSDHNRSELGIQDHSNEQSSSKLVPKVVPLAVKTATSRQKLELLFHLHISMLRTTAQEKG